MVFSDSGCSELPLPQITLTQILFSSNVSINSPGQPGTAGRKQRTTGFTNKFRTYLQCPGPANLKDWFWKESRRAYMFSTCSANTHSYLTSLKNVAEMLVGLGTYLYLFNFVLPGFLP